ncbi:hypothetical protein GQ53DRAFT_767721 [Thozetella sp. PMI_491]|nr:hypothetical protein GQ53DRAFT_767721 [Thozetella sp. PMI_491]
MVSPPLLVIAGVLCAVAVAEDAAIFSMANVQDWQRASTMKLSLAPEEGGAIQVSYDVIPLTTTLGLNQTERTRGAVYIHGNIVSATTANYVNLTSPDTVAYLSCDDLSNTSNITPSMMMTTLMNNRPKAILLYTTNGGCCGISGSSSSLPYQTIFTMTSTGEAWEALNWTARGDGLIQATISGNVSTPAQDNQDNQAGSNSAVAMSILYSITGLITLLFLVIIATGAIRAHRYPERYGPRSAYGGRSRQSRAKGIARAVLETLPIVKFGESNPPKPDPALELESNMHAATHDPNLGTRLSAIPEEPQLAQQRQSGMPTVQESGAGHDARSVSAPSEAAAGSRANSHAEPAGDEHLGCSICTEDFNVGEDVRVLPCDHKFHPACVDPWLMNVSGTCPLCRLDLRPPEEQDNVVTPDDILQVPLPPPLDADGNEVQDGGSSSNQARRSSRLLDLHRLRHASVEERMDILRRHVSQPQQSGSSPDGDAEEHGRRARLADRLRDKFRIHTRTLPAGSASSSS